jgi:hypothetical protein
MGKAHYVFHTELICPLSIRRPGHAETTASGGLCDAGHYALPREVITKRVVFIPTDHAQIVLYRTA